MKIRSFIAINLPKPLKREICFLIEKLKRENKNRPIKWVPNEGLHITLHFLGSQEESVLKRVGEAIENLKLKMKNEKLELKLEKLGGFPNLNRPRVLFIEVKEVGNGKLQNFQKELSKEIERLGIEVDKRDWIPHITLARLKTPMKFSIFNFQFSNLSFEVKSIDLMKSELTPTGAKYSILKSCHL